MKQQHELDGFCSDFQSLFSISFAGDSYQKKVTANNVNVTALRYGSTCLCSPGFMWSVQVWEP